MSMNPLMRTLFRPQAFRTQSPLMSRAFSRTTCAGAPLTKTFGSQFKSAFSPEFKSAFSRLGAQRSLSSPSVGARTQQTDWAKLGTGAAVFAGGALALHLFLNRDTRGPLSPFEASYLNKTFLWTGAGLALTAATARYAFTSGTVYRLMALNPWAFMGISLAGAFGTMMGVNYTATDNPLHYVCWAGFSALQGLTLSPLFFISPVILSRAALYTLSATTGICYIGATAQSDQYLYIGGPLMAALCVLLATNLAPLVFRSMSMRTLTMIENVSAYGGTAVFSGFILYDTQKILNHAKYAQFGQMKADPVRESVSLIIDVINLFTSIVRVLLLQQGGKRK